MAKKKKAKSKTTPKVQDQKKKKVSRKAKEEPSPEQMAIAIDEKNDLVFDSEEELYNHFKPVIAQLEENYFKNRPDHDIAVDNFSEFEECLPLLLEEPFEIWQDDITIQGQTIFNYIGEFEDDEKPNAEPIYYVAQVYLTDEIPSFVYLHFPSVSEKLVDNYRKGQVIFDISRSGMIAGALDGDALSEGDEFAAGLYQAMLKVRSDRDIPEASFHEFMDLREETIEEADEIWQNTDMQGNVMVSFVREFNDVELEGAEDDEDELYYVVVTLEEESSQTHALLFSFPTVDRNLVDRYRHGENLQADEVAQQSSH